MTAQKNGWARPAVDRLPKYLAGKPISEVERELGITDIIKMGSNENPLGPSPRALAAMAAAAAETNLYPDPAHFLLKSALAESLGVSVDYLVPGPGSTALIRVLAETCLRPGDEVVFPAATFPMYSLAARLMSGREVPVPLDNAGRHDLDAMAAAITPKTRLVFLCNPNNPTGETFSRAELDAFLEKVPAKTLVVLDEAYREYAVGDPEYPDGVSYLKAGRRMLVLRTFSKAFGLAGLRVGYAIAPPDIAAAMRAVRDPFAVSVPAQAAAVAALADHDYMRKVVELSAAGLVQLTVAAGEMGLRTYRSAANFVAMEIGEQAGQVAQRLLQKGIIVRPIAGFGLPGWIRVTTGTPEQNERFGQALKAVMAEARSL